LHGFVSGSSILFHWASCLFLYQYHAVFINMTLSSLKSGIVIPQAYYFGSGLLWIIWVYCASIRILRMNFLPWWRMLLEFW
jgi:hypothetical protein